MRDNFFQRQNYLCIFKQYALFDGGPGFELRALPLTDECSVFSTTTEVFFPLVTFQIGPH
jgi:hypothetical protein